jgi:hypothetical protein
VTDIGIPGRRLKPNVAYGIPPKPRDGGKVHYQRETRYAARVPQSDIARTVAAAQTYRLVMSGHNTEVVELANRVVATAEKAGLEVARPQSSCSANLADIPR